MPALSIDVRKGIGMNRRKRILTVFYYDDVGPQHMYKDVGSVPLTLGRYHGWDATLAYADINGVFHDAEYEKFVSLQPYHGGTKPLWATCLYILRNVQKYDVLNIYHMTKRSILLIAPARLRHPGIKVYVKLDMGRATYNKMKRWEQCFRNKIFMRIMHRFHLGADLYTVETKKYVDELNHMKLYQGRVKYLPNGFWPLPSDARDVPKENVILTVGRLGTVQKNTELLLSVFADLPDEIISSWQLILVGTYTDEIRKMADTMVQEDARLAGKITFTGNISDKSELANYYKKAAIFCLPSRWEGFSLAFIEALHHGVLPVVTDCFDGVTEILQNGKYGEIVPNENAEALRTALMNKMIHVKETIKAGGDTKEYADANFSWEILGKRLDAYLQRLLR